MFCFVCFVLFVLFRLFCFVCFVSWPFSVSFTPNPLLFVSFAFILHKIINQTNPHTHSLSYIHPTSLPRLLPSLIIINNPTFSPVINSQSPSPYLLLLPPISFPPPPFYLSPPLYIYIYKETKESEKSSTGRKWIVTHRSVCTVAGRE